MSVRRKFFASIFSVALGLGFPAAHINAQGFAANVRADADVSRKTRALVENAVRLAERQDKVVEALSLIKRAIAAEPHFVKAHVEYVRLKSYWLNKAEQTRAEYEELMKKEPENAAYPLALAAGATFAPAGEKLKWFERAARLAPETAWGHCAKSRATELTNAEAAVDESLKAVEKDSGEILFYSHAFALLLRQKKFAGAAALLEKIKARHNWRATALRLGWNLRLAEAGNSEAAKKAVDAELENLAETSKDLEILLAVRQRYETQKNEEKTKLVAEKISRLDPTWYLERGEVMLTVEFDGNSPKRNYFAGRQHHIHNQLKAIEDDLDPKEQLARAQALLTSAAGETVRKLIYERIFNAAVKAKDSASAVKYGELLLATDPNNVGILSGLGKILAAGAKKDLKKALSYSQRALELTEPARETVAANNRKDSSVALPEELLKQISDGRRLNALNSRAFVLAETGDYKTAETLLKQSLALKPTAPAYSLLENVLRKSGRAAEAAEAAAGGESFWRREILAGFKKEPSKDFELTTIKNERVKLSSLKGKIVLVNFWATWCVPCVKEMPILIGLYEKYKSQGLEILAVSVDQPEDRPKIPAFAAKTRMNFPVLYDENAASLYGVSSYPTTLFVDREGNLRYRTKGLDLENARRDLEFVILELLKNQA